MITEYIAKAMQKATYELLEDGTFYGEISLKNIEFEEKITCT
jgi:hypothetical protein